MPQNTEKNASIRATLAVLFLSTFSCSTANAQTEDLSKQLANPIASLISVPIQQNFDFGGGVGKNGFLSLTNIQPVIPIKLNDDWNLISRTIIPVIRQERLQPMNQFGMGDILQSFFFSPSKVGPSGLIWGVGPVFLLPTATNKNIGTEKWGAGPSAVALVQKGDWTVGMLANHIWSFAGNTNRQRISNTFMQPFVSYSLGGGRSIAGQVEATYDWVNRKWNIPVNLEFSQVFKVGDQAMSFSIGPKYYTVRQRAGSRWGVRAALVLLFPK